MAHVTPLRPRERRREARLTRILDAAMDAVTSGGFGSFSMNKLADAVDFTPGALYRYFDSKDSLLSALVNRILEDVNERLVAAVATAGEDPLVRIFALTRAYRAFASEQPHQFGLLAMSMAEPKVLLGTRQAAEPVMQSMVSALAPLADALSAAPLEPGDPVERTLIVFSSIQGALQLHKQARLAPRLIDVDRLSGAVVQTLLRGWGADARAVAAAYRKVLALGSPPSGGGSS